jgi:tetratricopeptide (TPR) repeat protein
MIRASLLGLLMMAATSPLYWIQAPQQTAASIDDQLWQFRNLGKAFYENSTTQARAVDEFKKALDLQPDSLRDRLNYGLALLRSGSDQGIEELRRVQQQDPSIPHTWFNLGIAFKRRMQFNEAIEQLEQMIRLRPDEPVSHFNLGVLYTQPETQDFDKAIVQFERAAQLDPNFVAPHGRLQGLYRARNRNDDAIRQQAILNDLQARQIRDNPDLEWSFYSEIYEPTDSRSLDRTGQAPLRPQPTDINARMDAATARLAVLDYDADGVPDVIGWSSQGIQLLKGGTRPQRDETLSRFTDVVDIAPGDFNNDGFVDLCIVTKTRAEIVANTRGRFVNAPPGSELVWNGSYSKAMWINYDHESDLDLILLGEKPLLLRNSRLEQARPPYTQQFVDQTTRFPFVSGRPAGATLFAVDPYRAASDIIVVYGDRLPVLYRDKLHGEYEAVPLGTLPPDTRSILAEDVNQDGWTDLIAGTSSGSVLILNRPDNDGRIGDLTGMPVPLPASPVLGFADLGGRGALDLVTADAIYRNLGQGRFAQEPEAPFKDRQGTPVRYVAAVEGNFDRNGSTDLIGVGADGRLWKNSNPSSRTLRWIEVSLTGTTNLKIALGSVVEVKAGSLYQKRIFAGIPLFFGLAGYNQIETIRITWPNATIQNEVNQVAGKRYPYREARQLSGSCPMIFTWNGHRFEFITDVLGVAPLGASLGDGQYFPVDHDEYIQIPGESLVAVNGQYEIRITEELREVSYLDKVQLIALDHPENTEIFTNDKFKGPPFPEFKLYSSDRRIYPVSAQAYSDSKPVSENVLDRLTAKDHRYPDGYRRDDIGVAERHYLELDFGSAAPRQGAVLVLNGWVDWADGSTFLAAAQDQDGGLSLPRLEVLNSSNEWQTINEDMGIPAGKPKTIAVELNDLFLKGSRKIRISTNVCVYWDEIFLIENNSEPPVRTDIKAATADLQFRGFSKPVLHPERKQPEAFDYSVMTPFRMWNPTPGMYTRYGDVLPLIVDDEPDDRMVIMGSGDELRLLFPATGLPALAPGCTRAFLILVDGWAKDGDLNTAYSQTVEPLPFHGMSAYPYADTEHFPDDKMHRDYVREFNTRPALRLIRPLETTSR